MGKFGAYSFLERVCAMFLKRFQVIIIGIALLILFSGYVHAHDWKVVHCEIRQVYQGENSILVDCSGEGLRLSLTTDCEILRKGKPTGIASLRPITDKDFQDALIWVNNQGQASYILVNYTVEEEDKGILVKRDIFGKIQ